MSFTFDADTKERVRAATDIVDLIGNRYELRRQGANFLATCPWHKDSHPSLHVNPARQIWKCFVCDIGGDVFNFVMQDEGISFPEALRKLAELAGISLGKQQRSYKASADIKAEVLRALTWADDFYHRYLLESDEGRGARDYLEQRGVSAESIKTFGIGLAPDSWSAVLDASKQKKFTPHILESAGLIKKRENSSGHFDFFRNRLMFPIRDREKQVIAFGGRVLPGDPSNAKYINSPDTRVFHKSQQLYGFDMAYQPIRRTRQAVVMEGYTDVIIANQFGLENVVAVLGVALGQSHLKTLKHYCDSIVLMLDGDAAGQRRSDEVLELFMHAQVDVRVLSLPDGMDPADFLLKHGSEDLQTRISSAVDALEFKMRRVTQGYDPLVDTHRAHKAVEEMLGLLAKVPHSGLISNESFRMRQNQILPRLARKFAIPEENLRGQLTNLRKRQSRFARRETPENEQPKRLMKPGDLSPYERELLELIIVAPQVAPIALERVQSGWLECKAAQAMLDAYQQLEFSGQSLEFESVLVALEDPSLKSLLVTLFEQANAKLEYTSDSAEDRLRVLTHRMGERQDAMRRQQQVNRLQDPKLTASEELDVLQDVIRQARLRQGLVESETSEQNSASVETVKSRHNPGVADGQHELEDAEATTENRSTQDSNLAAHELPSTEQSATDAEEEPDS